MGLGSTERRQPRAREPPLEPADVVAAERQVMGEVPRAGPVLGVDGVEPFGQPRFSREQLLPQLLQLQGEPVERSRRERGVASGGSAQGSLSLKT